ncbi:hypothetical protein [Lewinella sp. LCG006]|uniref:hypothetical protein n=1 Tax=Lewinella sp. LCG006 TaxID=3231911 RepID=UPI00346099E3
MRIIFFSLLIAGLFCSQCQSGATDQNQETAQTETATTVPAPATTETPTTPYPSITQEKMMHLYNNCDYIDFVFYSTNFSMSQNTQAAIRTTLGTVSTTPAKVISSCQPIGRVFFQIDGQNAEEADLFFGGACMYYLFLENGTYTYGNQLTEEGFGFYQKIFQQAASQGGQ